MKKKTTAQQKAHKKYEAEKRGPVVLRVQMSASDDPVEWEKIKQWLITQGGSAKQGIYKLAKKNKII